MALRMLALVGNFLATVLVSTIVVFLLLRVMPGDPATVALGIEATPEQLAAWRDANGTDAPLVVQYLDWLGGLVRGDFGTSYVSGQDISPIVSDRFQVTLILVVVAMLIALVVAIPLGTLAAMRQRHASGVVISGVSQLGVAVPNFLVGVLLVAVFAIDLRWFPSGGWVPPSDPEFLSHIALPAIALGSVQASILTRYVRSAVLEIMREDFLRTARSKGLTAGAALVKHGLRNAGIPVLTIVGVQLAGLFIGAVVIERVFSIPGLGSYLVDSVGNRDLLAVQAVVAVLVVAIVAINFLVDLAFTFLDPRLRRAA
ncbi:MULTISPECIES: ABC transporter permease [unclassified Rathayibacter]|jgi:peptide/nickel transport system permease protein|uniref:ABC transporter permease n=1 Tax=unclassified Rathayibacter TaxID=2609250 RepID=UPI00104ABC8F|nr:MULTISPECIES: ABC transporter permease [unclassified Rathayibacter]MCJ1702225.1 ABC transporter permease [Rathayibacter sp. VKM Ac-2926]TCL85404.1 peptide/nickel transport system permease protein [Rathayibacter sp. PhB192]TCM31225.1 peptide/nickel transport system permease protein [Rathayibacter sp. PhB179]